MGNKNSAQENKAKDDKRSICQLKKETEAALRKQRILNAKKHVENHYQRNVENHYQRNVATRANDNDDSEIVGFLCQNSEIKRIMHPAGAEDFTDMESERAPYIEIVVYDPNSKFIEGERLPVYDHDCHGNCDCARRKITAPTPTPAPASEKSDNVVYLSGLFEQSKRFQDKFGDFIRNVLQSSEKSPSIDKKDDQFIDHPTSPMSCKYSMPTHHDISDSVDIDDPRLINSITSPDSINIRDPRLINSITSPDSINIRDPRLIDSITSPDQHHNTSVSVDIHDPQRLIDSPTSPPPFVVSRDIKGREIFRPQVIPFQKQNLPKYTLIDSITPLAKNMYQMRGGQELDDSSDSDSDTSESGKMLNYVFNNKTNQKKKIGIPNKKKVNDGDDQDDMLDDDNKLDRQVINDVQDDHNDGELSSDTPGVKSDAVNQIIENISKGKIGDHTIDTDSTDYRQVAAGTSRNHNPEKPQALVEAEHQNKKRHGLQDSEDPLMSDHMRRVYNDIKASNSRTQYNKLRMGSGHNIDSDNQRILNMPMPAAKNQTLRKNSRYLTK